MYGKFFDLNLFVLKFKILFFWFSEILLLKLSNFIVLKVIYVGVFNVFNNFFIVFICGVFGLF